MGRFKHESKLACRRTEHRGKLETLAQQGHAVRREADQEMEGLETKLIRYAMKRRVQGVTTMRTGKACTKGQVFNS